jgi:protein-histidine pros-kinase
MAVAPAAAGDCPFELPGDESMIDARLLKGSGAVELLDQVLSASTEYSIVGIDLGGDILLWNEGAHRLFGWAPEEVIGSGNWEVLQAPEGDVAGRAARMRSEARGEGRWEGAVNCVRKDGSTFVAHTELTPRSSADGLPIGFMMVSKDISDELRLTHNVRAKRSFTRMFDSNMSPLMITDPLGTIVDINQQVEQLTGRTREELIGAALKDQFTNQDAALALTAVALGQGKVTDLELTVRVAGDEETDVVCSAATVFHPTGDLYGVFLALKDVTERKRHDRELELKNLALERADRGKDRFLASMSHELRSPLNIMLGYTGALIMGMAGPPSEDLLKHLLAVQAAGKYQLSIINDLLDLAKIEDGKWVGDFQPVACRAVAEEMTEYLRVIATDKGLKLSIAAPAQEITIVTDRRALMQILINLVSNAIKFTDRGEVRLEIQSRRPGGVRAVAFDVVDTGIGLEREEQAQLFRAFEQAREHSTAAHEGTGLGLYISQRLASELGGVISFKSRSARGSTFTLTLPYERPTGNGHAGE